MIRLFVADIDGCLAMPYEPFRLDRMQELAKLIARPDTPDFALCSGRSYAYVEAITQLLALSQPVLFESGGGMFDVTTGLSKLHPSFTPAVRSEVLIIREYLEQLIRAYPGLSIDYGKQTQAALVGVEENGLFEVLDRIKPWVHERYPQHHTFHTHISIDVVPEGLTKAEGLAWLGDTLDLEVSEMAYIGDSDGDLGALAVCGHSFAPSNADPIVKEAVDHASELLDIDSVIEAYLLVSELV
ncbi:MAG: HAD family hydrolase [Bacteroidetes bacterium]|nr:HAD family hydrolase [Bacteroidota bacterium]